MSSQSTSVTSSQESFEDSQTTGKTEPIPRCTSPDPFYSKEQMDTHEVSPRHTADSRLRWAKRKQSKSLHIYSYKLRRSLPEKWRSGTWSHSSGSTLTVGEHPPEEPTPCKCKRSNELLIFVGPIAVFTATLNAALLSFTHDILSGNNSNQSDSTVIALVTGQIILICFYLAMLLSLCAGAFAWLMHDDVLRFVWEKLGKGELDTNNVPVAMRNGSLFWVVTFILPSVGLTFVGLQVLVWSQSTIAVGVSLSFGMLFCFWQLYRVLRNIGAATDDNSTNGNVKHQDVKSMV